VQLSSGRLRSRRPAPPRLISVSSPYSSAGTRGVYSPGRRSKQGAQRAGLQDVVVIGDGVDDAALVAVLEERERVLVEGVHELGRRKDGGGRHRVRGILEVGDRLLSHAVAGGGVGVVARREGALRGVEETLPRLRSEGGEKSDRARLVGRPARQPKGVG